MCSLTSLGAPPGFNSTIIRACSVLHSGGRKEKPAPGRAHTRATGIAVAN